MPISVLINALEFAEQSLEIHDRIRASKLPRLQDVLFSDSGEIEYRLVGECPVLGKHSLRLKAHGTLELICQRCLGKLTYPVSIDRHFVLVVDDSALPESDLEDDEVDYLVADPKLDVVALVEEEILLALPLALRHEDECVVAVNNTNPQKPNPFRVLEGLKISTRN